VHSKGRSLYLFGDFLLILTRTSEFQVDYSVSMDADPKRLDLLYRPDFKLKLKAIYRVDQTKLLLCTTSLLQSDDELLDYPTTFQPARHSYHNVTELERIPVSLADITEEGLSDLVAQYCGPNPKTQQLDTIQKKRSKDAEEKIFQAAKLIGERSFKHEDYADSYHLEMSDIDRVPFAIFWLLDEVNNGGFHQYLYNGTGAIAENTLVQLEKIGAIKAAELLKEVLSFFPSSKPSSDVTIRRQQLEAFTDEQQERLSELDDLFFALEEDLNALAVKYLQM